MIGWAMAEHMRTDLICDAVTMAATHTQLPVGAIFHSERGNTPVPNSPRTSRTTE